MVIYLGCDHAAFEEKEALKSFLSEHYEVKDLGTNSPERCDYSDYAIAVAKSVQRDGGRGILLCGSGIGVSMVANRYKGIRAALCRTVEEAKLSRQHNDANILCLGARISSIENIKKMTELWLKENFEDGRHTQRIAKFDNLGEQ